MSEADESAPGKKKGKILTIVALAAITLLGAGGGWVVGGLLATPPLTAEEAKLVEEAKAAIKAKQQGKAPPAGAHGGSKKEEGLPTISAALPGLLQLDAITTNLAYPAENWVRLELALVFKGPSDADMAKTIETDIAAYLKTVSLQQIEGPRGLQYLKDDIKERVDLRSEGRISDVIIRTFVIQ
ncbi:flagellar basal body-associated FliL family protein [Rhizobium sp. YIM 134829]|uniref:flagellar basal body-associated FliL family protein n=1 Tax=Rhizobium sp. YIM 134829 TaxID=3390453 RepID=UPI00397C2957